jgi:putative transposase
MLNVVTDEQTQAELATDLDELVREGARRLLAAALEAEVDAYLAAHTELVDERGHRLVVRNGHAPVRKLTTAAGQVEVVRPRVDDRRVDRPPGQRVQSRAGPSQIPHLVPFVCHNERPISVSSGQPRSLSRRP